MILAIVCTTVTMLGCFSFGCCGVIYNMSSFCVKAGLISTVTFFGTAVAIVMTLTIYNLFYTANILIGIAAIGVAFVLTLGSILGFERFRRSRNKRIS